MEVSPPAVCEIREILEHHLPALAHAPIKSLRGGWDNWVYALGSEFVVKTPRRLEGSSQIFKEACVIREMHGTPGLPVSRSTKTAVRPNYPQIPVLIYRKIEGSPIGSRKLSLSEVHSLATDFISAFNRIHSLDMASRCRGLVPVYSRRTWKSQVHRRLLGFASAVRPH
ncbi:MAG: hypothetical protein QXI37_04260, partial [Thermoprotei archaeon]